MSQKQIQEHQQSNTFNRVEYEIYSIVQQAELDKCFEVINGQRQYLTLSTKGNDCISLNYDDRLSSLQLSIPQKANQCKMEDVNDVDDQAIREKQYPLQTNINPGTTFDIKPKKILKKRGKKRKSSESNDPDYPAKASKQKQSIRTKCKNVGQNIYPLILKYLKSKGVSTEKFDQYKSVNGKKFTNLFQESTFIEHIAQMFKQTYLMRQYQKNSSSRHYFQRIREYQKKFTQQTTMTYLSPSRYF